MYSIDQAIMLELKNKGFYMKVLFFGCLVVLTMNKVMALEVQSYKSNSGASKIVKVSDSEVESAVSSSTPVCFKDGAKLIKINKAFTLKGLGYSDCSTSAGALERQRLLNYKVIVYKLTQLSPKLAAEITK